MNNQYDQSTKDLPMYIRTEVENQCESNNENVRLVVVEEPISLHRYRWLQEGVAACRPVLGQNSNQENKSYPTVELHGFTGEALIRCRLYQLNKEEPHPHCLFKRHNGHLMPDPHDLQINFFNGYRAEFQGLVIMHTHKRNIAHELFIKKKSKTEFENGSDLSVEEATELRIKCDEGAKNVNLHRVLLRYEAYEVCNGHLKKLCEPIYSTSIDNKRFNELKIRRISSCFSSADGGDEIFLFVERISKYNIKVKFFEMKNGIVTWFDYGLFSESDVHYGYAIALTTPPYKNKDIDECVLVYIQLEAPLNGQLSDPIEFKYKPRDWDRSSCKRARLSSDVTL